MSESWTAIVLAGQRPGMDPLASHFGERLKARIAVAGEPMIGRVVRTLQAVPRVDRILILAQDPAALTAPPLDWIARQPDVAVAARNAGIAASIATVAGGPLAPWPVLVTTADHPLLTRAIIDEFLDGVGAVDLAIGMVERRTILAIYPETRRTWLKFREGAYSGANLFALKGPNVMVALRLWMEAEKDRKKVYRLFARFGPWLAFRAITRTIRFDAALKAAGRRLGLAVGLVVLDSAEASIDVDKVTDHALAEGILRAREGGS